MDNDFQLDVAEALAAVQRAEVLTIFFPLIGQALLMDTRSDEVEGPLVCAIPMVPSVEERVRSLERLRPHFGRPRGIIAVPWYRRVASLKDLGVIARIADRVGQSAGGPVDYEAAFEELLRLEHEQLMSAVKGNEYQTLWHRG